MKVSSSKFTFSLIAFAALLVSGSGLMIQDSYAAIDAPEFTCIHINTTATHCTFDKAVNGTLAIADWGIRAITTSDNSVTITCTDGCADGDTTYDYEITNIANSTAASLQVSGIGLTVPGTIDKKTGVSSGTGVVGLGFLNGTDFVFIHEAIPTDATYFVNYTNNPATLVDAINQFGQIYSEAEGTSGKADDIGGYGVETANFKYLKIGSNATAEDWIVPTASSAEVLKSNPKQVRITMSEPVVNINSTFSGFTLTTSGGGNAAVPATLTAGNGTNYIYVNLQNPVRAGDVLTIAYNTLDGSGAAGLSLDY